MIVEFLLLLIFAVHIPKIIFKTLPIIFPLTYNSTPSRQCVKKGTFNIAILKAWEKTNIKTENTNTFLKNFGAKAIQENK